MTPSNLIRLRGFALLAAGVLLALFFLLHPGGGDPPTLEAARHPLYGVEHTFGMASFVLMLFGLEGARERQSSKMGLLGTIGFGLAFAGSALLLGVVFFDGYASPILAANAPQLLDANGPFNTFPGLLPLALAGIVWGVGFIALGIATLRAGVLPRSGSWLVIVGSIVVNLPQQRMGPASLLVITLGAVGMGAGLAWWGYAMWLGT
jgi:hypothetical protein